MYLGNLLASIVISMIATPMAVLAFPRTGKSMENCHVELVLKASSVAGPYPCNTNGGVCYVGTSYASRPIFGRKSDQRNAKLNIHSSKALVTDCSAGKCYMG